MLSRYGLTSVINELHLKRPQYCATITLPKSPKVSKLKKKLVFPLPPLSIWPHWSQRPQSLSLTRLVAALWGLSCSPTERPLQVSSGSLLFSPCRRWSLPISILPVFSPRRLLRFHVHPGETFQNHLISLAWFKAIMALKVL